MSPNRFRREVEVDASVRIHTFIIQQNIAQATERTQRQTWRRTAKYDTITLKLHLWVFHPTALTGNSNDTCCERVDVSVLRHVKQID
jgi:hypothetical protein